MKNIARKNQIIITTLAIMIAVAGFLNYSGKETSKEKSSLNNSASVTTQESVDMADISDADIYAKTKNMIEQTMESTGESLSEDVAETIESLDNEPDSEVSAENTTEISENTPGEAVLANSNAVASIADLKLTREQVRSKNKETLNEIVNNASLSDEQKKSAVNEMVNLTDISEKEAATEILLQAKGFNDVVVNIENDTVDVIVNMTELTDANRAQIEDIVKRKTGIMGENIVITTLNSAK